MPCTHQTYTPVRARDAAALCLSAYDLCDKPQGLRLPWRERVASRCRRLGYPETDPFDEDGVQGFTATAPDRQVVCFRGTDEGSDWLRNLDGRQVPFATQTGLGAPGLVHAGFLSGWLAVRWLVESGLDPEKETLLCGHSLGAALAVLAAANLKSRGYRIGDVYLYGCPRVGDPDFAEWYDDRLGDRTWRHVHNADLVCRVPLGIPDWLRGLLLRAGLGRRWPVLRLVPAGYRHVGQLVYYDEYHRWVRPAPGPLWRAWDALRGIACDAGELGLDGRKDHSMLEYLECVIRAEKEHGGRP
jgi:hypothetical protein